MAEKYIGKKFDSAFSRDRLISSERVLKNKNILFTVSMKDDIENFLNDLGKLKIEKKERKIHNDFIYVEGKTDTEKVKIGFHRDDKIGFFITDMRKSDQIKSNLEKPIRKVRDISQLWINPNVLNSMVDSFYKNYDNFKISWFSGIYKPKGEMGKNIRRPDKERSLQYSGEDGLESFLELREELGIKPKIMEFSLSKNRRYRIDNRGIITIREGNLKPLYGPIKEAVKELEPWADAIRDSKIERKQISLTDYTLNPDLITPWKMNIPRSIYSYEVDTFEDEIANDWNFATLRNYLNENKKGVVKNYSSQYFDKIDNSSFRVNYSEEKGCFSIYPYKKKSFSGGIRFVQAMRDLEKDIVAC
ncbi:MAG: hypothetical protein ACOC5T_07260 [Elusimicrobiota bacterium]